MTSKAKKLAYGHGISAGITINSSLGYIASDAYIPIIGYDIDTKAAWVIDRDSYPTFLGLTMDSDYKSAWLDLLESANKQTLGDTFLTIMLNEDMTYVRQ